MQKQIIGDCTLYCGNSLEVLPEIENIDDVVGAVMDPPYGIEDIVGGYGRAGRTIKNDRNLDVFKAVYEYIEQNLDDLYLFAFYSCRISPLFFDIVKMDNWYGEIIWNKKAPGMGKGIRYQHENIAISKFGDPEKIKDIFSVITDYRCGELHPHQKPVPTMKKLVKILPSSGIILDTFMGSGTTGVACAELGRKFIGIELEQEYFDLSCKRIESAYDQPDLFVEQPKDEKQQEALL